MYQLQILCDKQFPEKNDIISLVEHVRSQYENGNTSTAVGDFVTLKQMEFYVKEAMKIVAPYATAAVAGMSAEQRKNTCNAKLSLRQAPMKYDFRGNAEWERMKAQKVETPATSEKAPQNEEKAVNKRIVEFGSPLLQKIVDRVMADKSVTMEVIASHYDLTDDARKVIEAAITLNK